MKKVTKWITQTEYVVQATGEVITKWIAENEYRIIKQVKHIKYEQKINKRTRNYETVGIITRTNECGTEGRQTTIW